MSKNIKRKTAYNQVQKKVSALEEQLVKKFLSHPNCKAITEEYNKVFK